MHYSGIQNTECGVGQNMRSLKMSRLTKHPSLADQAYTILKRQIMYNELKPGTVLHERSVSEALGISRTPVRDAFTMLENQGWIMKQGTNKVVKPFTLQDLKEIVQIRMGIEEIVLQLAFEKLNKKNLAHFQYILSEMEAAAHVSDNHLLFIEKDINFHLYLAEICGNETIAAFFNTLCEKLIRSAVISIENGHVMIDTRIHEHEEMLFAFEHRNYNAAHRLLKKHVHYWQESLGESFHFLQMISEDSPMTEFETINGSSGAAASELKRKNIVFEKLTQIGS